MKKQHLLILLLIGVLFFSGFSQPIFSGCIPAAAGDLFLPPDDQIWFFVGQDLGAVGGLDEYTEGYVDYIGLPAGVTTYTNLTGLDGLKEKANWGAGDIHAEQYLKEERFANSMLAIGLYLVNQLDEIIAGERDEQIRELGSWIKDSNRLVFLRIGYEFEGEWNNYEPELYKKAFRHIVEQFRMLNVNNYVTVWQSSGYFEDIDYLLQWYPGDDYVDWLGYSYFDHDPARVGSAMLAIARKKNKPVMIAEVTPKPRDLLFSDGKQNWEQWFKPYFAHIYHNKDLIRAVAYINARWSDQAMWKNGWGDSRVFVDQYIRENWVGEMKKGVWAHGKISNDKKFVKPAREEVVAEKATEFTEKGVVEAENAKREGNVKDYPDLYASNGKGLAYIMDAGDRLWFEDMPAVSKVTIRYASLFNGTLGLYVDQHRIADFAFTATAAWQGKDAYQQLTVNIDIPAGSTFAVKYDQGDLAANIDYFKFENSASQIVKPLLPEAEEKVAGFFEAEEANFTGNVRKYQDGAASGREGLAYIMEAGDLFWLEGVPASSAVTIHYTSEQSGTLGIYVNGRRVEDFRFSSTGSWLGAYRAITIEVDIPERAFFAIKFDQGDQAANIDYLVFE